MHCLKWEKTQHQNSDVSEWHRLQVGRCCRSWGDPCWGWLPPQPGGPNESWVRCHTGIICRVMSHYRCSGWWIHSYFFNVHLRKLGKMNPFWWSYFSKGLVKNHQLVLYWFWGMAIGMAHIMSFGEFRVTQHHTTRKGPKRLDWPPKGILPNWLFSQRSPKSIKVPGF